jgi:hypothetical protein
VRQHRAVARTAAQRRAARKRKDARWRGTAAGTSSAGPRTDAERLVRQLIAEVVHSDDADHLERTAAALAQFDGALASADLLTGLLVGLLRELWERGFQPADVVHVVRRNASARVARLAVGTVAAEARSAGAATRAPAPWLAQLAAMGADGAGSPDVVGGWRRAEGLDAFETWRDVLRLLHGLTGLGELPHLLPPPSRWGSRPHPSPGRPAPADARVLGRIRGLLAKAESTEFPEEAEALSAKAQELMTRHAVDAAVLAAERGRAAGAPVGARRVHVDNPYPEGKVRLLDAVGTANDVRVVWSDALGMATMIGRAEDMDAVELLFTSLLVQANRAMTATGRTGSARTRSPAFRRAFLMAYAGRIGERLGEVRERVTGDAARDSGTDLVPLMRARSEAVDDAVASMFPRLQAKQTRAVDARGWYAGRAAADDAVLGSRRSAVADRAALLHRTVAPRSVDRPVSCGFASQRAGR